MNRSIALFGYIFLMSASFSFASGDVEASASGFERFLKSFLQDQNDAFRKNFDECRGIAKEELRRNKAYSGWTLKKARQEYRKGVAALQKDVTQESVERVLAAVRVFLDEEKQNKQKN